MHGMLPQGTHSQDTATHTGAPWGHAGQKRSLGVVGQGVGGDLPVVLLHAGHDVVLVVHAVVPLLVLAALLQRKGHQRQPLAAADQLEVACMGRCAFTTLLAEYGIMVLSGFDQSLCTALMQCTRPSGS